MFDTARRQREQEKPRTPSPQPLQEGAPANLIRPVLSPATEERVRDIIEKASSVGVGSLNPAWAPAQAQPLALALESIGLLVVPFELEFCSTVASHFTANMT